MKVSTVTGSQSRDYIELRAENAVECAALVRVGTSPFLPVGSTLMLTAGSGTGETVELRVYVGTPKQLELSPATRDAIDETS